MSEKTLPLDYANVVLYELEKAFMDERGRGARFRVTTVGRGYFAEKVRPLLQSTDLGHILHVVETVLREEGIASQVEYNCEEKLLRVRIAGCLHRPVEEKMIAAGVEPFTCVPINLAVLAIEEMLDRPVELAEIKVEADACHLLLILFDKRPSLD